LKKQTMIRNRQILALWVSLRKVKLFASNPRLAKEHASAAEEMRAIFGAR
jgi:hypothetical protein